MKILKDIERCLRGRMILRKKQLSTFSTKEWWSTIRTEKCTLYFSVWRLLFWTEQLTSKVFRNQNLCYRQIRQLFSSVQFSSSVVSDSLWTHESPHSRPPCSSPTPGVYSNSCPSNQWCHPTISSSVIPVSSCPQSLPASGSFPMSQLLTWGRQSIGVSASASVLPMKTQDWSPLRWTGWISLQSKRLSRDPSNTTV